MTLDSLGMHAAALALPEQVADAAASVEQGIDGLPDRERVSHVLALGMGGSGIAGDVLSVVAGPVRAGADLHREGLRASGLRR